jgi:precorrin-4 methylase
MTLEEVMAVYESHKDEAGLIARLLTGDPSVYGAIQDSLDFCAALGYPRRWFRGCLRSSRPPRRSSGN